MSENQDIETTDTEGHKLARVVKDDDDTEGHGGRYGGLEPEPEDTEGHKLARVVKDDDDTEGHGLRGH